MPTYDEQEELLNNCIWELTTENGFNGYKVAGPNGNSIFLPAAGYRYGTTHQRILSQRRPIGMRRDILNFFNRQKTIGKINVNLCQSMKYNNFDE